MAKVKAAKGQSSNWGGVRPNSGEPKRKGNYSDALKAQVFAALEEKAKETGVTFGKLIVDAAYEGSGNLKAASLKIISDMMTVKESKQTTVEEVPKAKVYLPEYKPVVQEEAQQTAAGNA